MVGDAVADGGRVGVRRAWSILPPLSLGDQLADPGQACYAMSSWRPQAVGSQPEGASPFGVLDMAGNTWEWTSTPFLPIRGLKPFLTMGIQRII